MPIYKNGKYGYKVVISFTLPNGERKQVVRCNENTRTKSDAKNYEVKLQNEIKLGIDKRKNNPTLSELYNEYILFHSKEVKKSTIRTLEHMARDYILPYFCDVPIDLISKSKVQKWHLDIDKSNLSIVTKNNIYGVFSSILNYAMKYYDLPFNAVAYVGKFKDNSTAAPNHEEQIHYWTYDQFKVFQKELLKEVEEKNNIEYRAIYVCFNILYFTGLRKGEMHSLTWNDLIKINDAYFFDINKSMNMKVYPYEITSPKNKSSIRKVIVPDELKSIIFEYYQYCKDSIVNFTNKFYISGTLAPIADTTLDNVKKKIIKRTNLPYIRTHDFRHSYCSLLLNGNIPLKTIASLLGHSTIEITQKVYSHMFPDQNFKVVEYINSLNNKK